MNRLARLLNIFFCSLVLLSLVATGCSYQSANNELFDLIELYKTSDPQKGVAFKNFLSSYDQKEISEALVNILNSGMEKDKEICLHIIQNIVFLSNLRISEEEINNKADTRALILYCKNINGYIKSHFFNNENQVSYFFSHHNENVKLNIFSIIMGLQIEKYYPYIQNLATNDSSVKVRLRCADELGLWLQVIEWPLDILIKMLNDQSKKVKQTSAYSIINAGHKEKQALKILIESLFSQEFNYIDKKAILNCMKNIDETSNNLSGETLELLNKPIDSEKVQHLKFKWERWYKSLKTDGFN